MSDPRDHAVDPDVPTPDGGAASGGAAGDVAADGAGDAAGDVAADGAGDVAGDEVVAARPPEAARPIGPLGLAGVGVVGVAMGLVEVVPGFSSGTIALVAGLYERLIANIRQGARVLSLVVRGRPAPALEALRRIEWPFVLLLFLPMGATAFVVAGRLHELLDARPMEMSAVFVGLVLGAAVVGTRQLRRPRPWHWLLSLATGAALFVVLGFTPGTIEDPSLLVLLIGGAIAICAWILPGVSGAFLLVLLGLYTPVLQIIRDRDVLAMAVFAVGMVLGLAAFSTALNWLLARAHDVVLAIGLGLLLGSVRVLWPWPVGDGFGATGALAGPDAPADGFLALALGLVAFSVVWMLGLTATAIQRRRARRHGGLADADEADEVVDA